MAATKIAYIQARWHTEITDNARTAFVDEIQAQGYREHDVEFFSVPGSLEIPLMAKKLAQTGRYVAVCCSGLVVDGGIYRHEFVAATVVDALMRVQLDTDVPVFSAVLTPHHFHEHDEHLAYFARHFEVKGAELASAIAATLSAQVATA